MKVLLSAGRTPDSAPDDQPSSYADSLTSRRCSFSPCLYLSPTAVLAENRRPISSANPTDRPSAICGLSLFFRISEQVRRNAVGEAGRPFPFPLCHPARFERRRRCGIRVSSGPDWVHFHCNAAALLGVLRQMWDVLTEIRAETESDEKRARAARRRCGPSLMFNVRDAIPREGRTRSPTKNIVRAGR